MTPSERDTIWAQFSSLATELSRINKKIETIRQQQVKVNSRLERLEDKELLSPVRVTVEFRNEKDATEFKQYVKEEKDVAIPVGQRPGEDKFIPARLVED